MQGFKQWCKFDRVKGVAVLTDAEEFENLQARLDLLESIYKAEIQINSGGNFS